MKEKILITKPLMPDEAEVQSLLKEVMQSGWLTNMGHQHNALEAELKAFLKVPNLSLFNNGTIALIVALKALKLPHGSEVITTPFTFAATPHAIAWNGLKPIFADINEETMTLDPEAIEKAITPNTSAILPVHVYGFPCDVAAIDAIAKKHNLKVIYDGAHAFTTDIDGKSICEWGDITMLSFHATKLFNSIEGGGLVYNDPALGKLIYELRNFGIKYFDGHEAAKEGIKTSSLIDEVGINGKMNEFQAAWGRATLPLVREEQKKRQELASKYIECLSEFTNIDVPHMPNGVTKSMQYFPIIIPSDKGFSRDKLYQAFLEKNIYSRKYFYPLCSEFECYKGLSSSAHKNLPIAHKVADNVLCLPFYGELFETGEYKRVTDVVKNFQGK